MYTLEHNPQILSYHSVRIRIRFPFDRMQVGECMLFDDFRRAESARVAAIQFVKRRNLDWRFSIRKSSDGWRIIRVL